MYGRDAFRGVLTALLAAFSAIACSAQNRPAGVNYVRTEKAFPTGDRNTSAILLERFAPAEIRSGAEYTYELKLTNMTRGRIEDVVLVEQFAATFNVRGIGPQPGRNDGGSATWIIPALEGGQTLNVQVSGSTNRPDEMNFCATVTFKTTACAATRVVQPALAIRKVMPPEVMVCDEIPIRVTVTNTGSGVARNVVVEDALPAGLTTPDGKNGFRSMLGDLGAGQSRDVAVVTRAARPGSYTNVARASEEGGLSAEASATTVVRSCALAVRKTGPAQRFIGRPATFDITVSNSGDAVARDVVLTDQLPAGCEVIGADGNGQLGGGRMTWSLGAINPNEAKTVRVSVKPLQGGTVTNTATARGYCCEATGSASMLVQGIPAILLECVDDPDPIEVGGQCTYEIVVTNQGSAVGTNVVIEATLPAQEQYVSGAGPTTGTINGQTIRFAPLASLAPKATAVYKIVVRGVRAGDVRFKVTLKSDQMDSPVEETESTHIYE